MKGSQKWLSFLVAVERDRTIRGTVGWRLAVRPGWPSWQRRGAKLQRGRPQSEPQSRRSPVGIIHEMEKGFSKSRSLAWIQDPSSRPALIPRFKVAPHASWRHA